MIYVVGSGPAGVSCAMALLKEGARVTMLDSGLELESERSEQLRKLRAVTPEKWQPAELAFIKAGVTADRNGIPLKYAYGSDFPYKDPGVNWQLKMDDIDMRPSFARGGLSNVWGAAILPYRTEDMREWPIQETDLTDHYRAVLNFMPLAGRYDVLQELFPLYSENVQALRLSNQADSFLKDLHMSAGALKREGISYGASRLAIWAQSDDRSSGCHYCGQCMYGCPYGVIYGSSHTLDALRENQNFTYKNNVIVDRVSEHGEHVALSAHVAGTSQPLRLTGTRVFLACGVLGTTKILLESLDAYNRPVVLQDSAYFLLPLLRLHATPDAAQERLHTLAQAFLEIRDPQVCDDTVHLQIYTYNELYQMALKRLIGSPFRLFRGIANLLLSRVLLIQGYLPSSSSHGIRIVLQKDPGVNGCSLQLTPIMNEHTAAALKKVHKKLMRNKSLLRALPVGPLLRVGQPGRSFHSGGTFPMRASPGEFQSDRYGRPYGFSRVHAVDSTVFPSIPATTITLSVMANAHRIGSGISDY